MLLFHFHFFSYCLNISFVAIFCYCSPLQLLHNHWFINVELAFSIFKMPLSSRLFTEFFDQQKTNWFYYLFVFYDILILRLWHLFFPKISNEYKKWNYQNNIEKKIDKNKMTKKKRDDESRKGESFVCFTYIDGEEYFIFYKKWNESIEKASYSFKKLRST